MKATERLHELGQSLWLDNITRDLLTSGTLQRYINELSVTGLTSNPSIFDHAVTHSASYDAEIRRLIGAGKAGEALFFELAIQDLTKAADLFAPIHQRTAGVDGWVSLEVSPLLAHDTARTIADAKALHAKANRPNLFIKIPGTLEGLPAIEEAIFAGVPINVTLLFSRDDYVRAADAYMRGLERRVEAGLSPDVRSVASVFVSRWDKATLDKVPQELRDRLGIAVSQQSYKAYRDLLDCERWQRLEGWGARPQRLFDRCRRAKFRYASRRGRTSNRAAISARPVPSSPPRNAATHPRRRPRQTRPCWCGSRLPARSIPQPERVPAPARAHSDDPRPADRPSWSARRFRPPRLFPPAAFHRRALFASDAHAQ